MMARQINDSIRIEHEVKQWFHQRIQKKFGANNSTYILGQEEAQSAVDALQNSVFDSVKRIMNTYQPTSSSSLASNSTLSPMTVERPVVLATTSSTSSIVSSCGRPNNSNVSCAQSFSVYSTSHNQDFQEIVTMATQYPSTSVQRPAVQMTNVHSSVQRPTSQQRQMAPDTLNTGYQVVSVTRNNVRDDMRNSNTTFPVITNVTSYQHAKRQSQQLPLRQLLQQQNPVLTNLHNERSQQHQLLQKQQQQQILQRQQQLRHIQHQQNQPSLQRMQQQPRPQQPRPQQQRPPQQLPKQLRPQQPRPLLQQPQQSQLQQQHPVQLRLVYPYQQQQQHQQQQQQHLQMRLQSPSMRQVRQNLHLQLQQLHALQQNQNPQNNMRMTLPMAQYPRALRVPSVVATTLRAPNQMLSDRYETPPTFYNPDERGNYNWLNKLALMTEQLNTTSSTQQQQQHPTQHHLLQQQLSPTASISLPTPPNTSQQNKMPSLQPDRFDDSRSIITMSLPSSFEPIDRGPSVSVRHISISSETSENDTTIARNCFSGSSSIATPSTVPLISPTLQQGSEESSAPKTTSELVTSSSSSDVATLNHPVVSRVTSGPRVKHTPPSQQAPSARITCKMKTFRNYTLISPTKKNIKSVNQPDSSESQSSDKNLEIPEVLEFPEIDVNDILYPPSVAPLPTEDTDKKTVTVSVDKDETLRESENDLEFPEYGIDEMLSKTVTNESTSLLNVNTSLTTSDPIASSMPAILTTITSTAIFPTVSTTIRTSPTDVTYMTIHSPSPTTSSVKITESLSPLDETSSTVATSISSISVTQQTTTEDEPSTQRRYSLTLKSSLETMCINSSETKRSKMTAAEEGEESVVTSAEIEESTTPETAISLVEETAIISAEPPETEDVTKTSAKTEDSTMASVTSTETITTFITTSTMAQTTSNINPTTAPSTLVTKTMNFPNIDIDGEDTTIKENLDNERSSQVAIATHEPGKVDFLSFIPDTSIFKSEIEKSLNQRNIEMPLKGTRKRRNPPDDIPSFKEPPNCAINRPNLAKKNCNTPNKISTCSDVMVVSDDMGVGGKNPFIPEESVPDQIREYIEEHYQTILEKLGGQKDKMGNKLHVHFDGSVEVQLSDGESVRIRYKELIRRKFQDSDNVPDDVINLSDDEDASSPNVDSSPVVSSSNALFIDDVKPVPCVVTTLSSTATLIQSIVNKSTVPTVVSLTNSNRNATAVDAISVADNVATSKESVVKTTMSSTTSPLNTPETCQEKKEPGSVRSRSEDETQEVNDVAMETDENQDVDETADCFNLNLGILVGNSSKNSPINNDDFSSKSRGDLDTNHDMDPLNDLYEDISDGLAFVSESSPNVTNVFTASWEPESGDVKMPDTFVTPDNISAKASTSNSVNGQAKNQNQKKNSDVKDEKLTRKSMNLPFV